MWLRFIIAIPMCTVALVFTSGPDVTRLMVWSAATVLAVAVLRPRPTAIAAGGARSRLKAAPRRAAWGKQVQSGFLAGLLMTALVCATPIAPSIATSLHDAWCDRDRNSFEATLGKLERSGCWQEAVTAINVRLSAPISGGWRTGLESRRHHDRLENAVRHTDARPSMEAIRNTTRASDFTDVLTLSLLQGLDAAAEVERLLQLMETERNQVQVEKRSLALAHLDTLVAFSDELKRHPLEVQALLAAGEALAAQHGVTHHELRDRQQAWTPPQRLPLEAKLDVLGTTQQGPIVTITLAISAPDGTPVTELTPRDFAITHNTQLLRRFTVVDSQATPEILQLAMLLDHSASTAGAPLQSAIAGLTTLVDAMSGQAQQRLWTFANDTQAATTWTTSSSDIIAKLSTIRAEGRTALLRALDAGSIELAQRSGRRVLVIFSDGKDTSGGPSLDGILSRCREHAITAYVVALRTNDLDLPPLERLAEETGGRLFVVEQANELVPTFHTLRTALQRPAYRLVILSDHPFDSPLRIQIGTAPHHAIEIHP